jgi:sugar phosphate isomerase/epimerase
VSDDIVEAAEGYASCETAVTIENMPLFDGFYVPLATPQELLAFVSDNELGVTLDTTHYAQDGLDVVQAARVLRAETKTVHLGDYVDGKTHVFIGDGDLDFASVLRVFDLSRLHSLTVECSVGFHGEDAQTLNQEEMVDRLKTAMRRLQGWIQAA